MKNFKCLLSILLIMTVLMATACPSQSIITKAINAAEKVDSITQTAVDVANAAYTEGLLTLDQKEKLLPKLNLLAKGSTAFQNAATILKNEYHSGEIPNDKLLILSRMLETDVVAPFLDVLSELKLIKNASKVLAAIGLINLALVSILQAFEKEVAIKRINEKWTDAGLVFSQ